MEICERILRNTKDYDQLTGELAYQILLTRDSLRAKNIYEEITILQNLSSTISEPQTEIVSNITEYTGKTIYPNAKLLNRIKRNLV